MERRHLWLAGLPEPRSTTVLLENIPEKYCTDGGLRAFFEQMFTPEEVREATMVKRSGDGGIAGALGDHPSTGFVTFVKRTTASLAIGLQYTTSREEFRARMPPDPADVLFA